MVSASEDELEPIAPASATTERDRVSAVLDAGVPDVVVKRGAEGATGRTATAEVHTPARPVPVVDPVGAGDAFVAGYLSGLLDGLGLTARLDRAVTTGAFAVAAPDDWDGLPTSRELPFLRSLPGTTLH